MGASLSKLIQPVSCQTEINGCQERYRIIVEFEFEFEFEFELTRVRVASSRWRSLSAACTSKAGVSFFCKPNVNERGADRGSDVCAREQTMVSQATPFAVRVWLAGLRPAQWVTLRNI